MYKVVTSHELNPALSDGNLSGKHLAYISKSYKCEIIPDDEWC